MFHRRQISRSAYTLVELVVASMSSMLLLAGMGGSIFIASKAFEDKDSQSFTAIAAGNVADEVMAEMQYATRFYERTPQAVTFSIPDRDGDGGEEKLRYAWSGVAGEPLTKQLNGSPATVLVDRVQNVNFTYLTRTLIALPPVVVADDGVVYQEFNEATLATAGQVINIPVPAGAAEGDLLIAVAAIEGDMSNSLAPAASGWNLVVLDHRGGDVTLGVWWKLASSSEPASYGFTWSSNKKAYGWIMRFTGHNPASPINAWATESSDSSTPPSPAVTTTVDNALILRLVGIKEDRITTDQPGLSGHSPITMDGVDRVSGGAGYVQQATMGTSGTSTFAVTGKSKCIAATVAIAPAPP